MHEIFQEADMPLDASDIEDIKQAKYEIMRLRQLIHFYRNKQLPQKLLDLTLDGKPNCIAYDTKGNGNYNSIDINGNGYITATLTDKQLKHHPLNASVPLIIDKTLQVPVNETSPKLYSMHLKNSDMIENSGNDSLISDKSKNMKLNKKLSSIKERSKKFLDKNNISATTAGVGIAGVVVVAGVATVVGADAMAVAAGKLAIQTAINIGQGHVEDKVLDLTIDGAKKVCNEAKNSKSENIRKFAINAEQKAKKIESIGTKLENQIQDYAMNKGKAIYSSAKELK